MRMDHGSRRKENIMNKETLISFRSMKAEIRELRKKIGSEADGNICVQDTYKERLKELEESCKAVEIYVESISDSLTRRIFRMIYIDGLTQKEVGRAVNLDHSRISRKITEYLNTHD